MALKVDHLESIIALFFMSCCYGRYVDATYYGSGTEPYDSQACPSTYFDENNPDLLKLHSWVLGDMPSFGQVIGDTMSASAHHHEVFNVHHFGAKGDGSQDDTQAFEKAWEAACSAEGGASVVEVPEGNKYLLKPISFDGPCKSNLTLRVRGTVEASDDPSDYEQDTRHWIKFDGVQNLVVEGGGTIDGNGNIWWQNSCKINKKLPCKHAPTGVTFYKCEDLTVNNIKIQNAQQMHISFQKCTSVVASNLVVTSPGHSPNTDGIHVTATKNIRIADSVIGTGDDCISIVSGSENVLVSNITCGPGHGISIGSLGSGNSEAYVSGVTVKGAKLSGTSNGVRIKTWQGGSGTATDIKFKDIEMENVTHPIIIDQNYCDQDDPCDEQTSAVQVKNVVYENITGTSASREAVKFDCSKTYPCRAIVLEDVDLVGLEGKSVTATCHNVKLVERGFVSPICNSDDMTELSDRCI